MNSRHVLHEVGDTTQVITKHLSICTSTSASPQYDVVFAHCACVNVDPTFTSQFENAFTPVNTVDPKLRAASSLQQRRPRVTSSCRPDVTPEIEKWSTSGSTGRLDALTYGCRRRHVLLVHPIEKSLINTLQTYRSLHSYLNLN